MQTLKNLQERVEELENAIRKHRDQKLDDRCWMDDFELYKVLNEPIPEDQNQLHEPCTMMANCVRFIKSRHYPGLPYVTVQDKEEVIIQSLGGIEEMLHVIEQKT